MSETTTQLAADARFSSRAELADFVRQEARSAVQPPPDIDRRVPWATSGPVGRDSAGYSVLKAAAYALGVVGPDEAKEEIHAHQQLRELYSAYGFVPHCGAASFLVPWATSHLPAFEPRGERLRSELRQKMAAGTDGFDPDEAAWIGDRIGLRRKALGTLISTSGGSLVPPARFGELIDLQRSMEALSRAGAREVSLPPNGRLSFPKLTGGAVAYWVGEGVAVTESQPSTGNLDLQAKKLGVFVKVNNELLRFASPSAEALIRTDMARTAALTADKAMLEGTGGATQIKGLTTYAGLPKYIAEAGTNGDTFRPEDVAAMEALLPDEITTPTAWVMRKQMFASLITRRANADGEGPFLLSPNRGVASPPPIELYGTPVVRSSQVSDNREKGSGEDLTYILLGHFPDWIVARLGVMEFMASGYGDSALQNDQTYLRGIQHIDAGPRHLESFVMCDNLLMQ